MYKVQGFLDEKLVIDWRLAHIPTVDDQVALSSGRQLRVIKVIHRYDVKDHLFTDLIHVQIELAELDAEQRFYYQLFNMSGPHLAPQPFAGPEPSVKSIMLHYYRIVAGLDEEAAQQATEAYINYFINQQETGR